MNNTLSSKDIITEIVDQISFCTKTLQSNKEIKRFIIKKDCIQTDIGSKYDKASSVFGSYEVHKVLNSEKEEMQYVLPVVDSFNLEQFSHIFFRVGEQFYLQEIEKVLETPANRKSQVVAAKRLIENISKRKISFGKVDFLVPQELVQAFVLCDLVFKINNKDEALLRNACNYLMDLLICSTLSNSFDNVSYVVDKKSHKDLRKEWDRNVHMKGYWHKATDILPYTIMDSQAYILVGKRSPEKYLFPNVFSLLGGQNYTQTSLQTAKSEFFEESQLSTLVKEGFVVEEEFTFTQLGKVYENVMKLRSFLVTSKKELEEARRICEEAMKNEETFDFFTKIHLEVKDVENTSSFVHCLVQAYTLSNKQEVIDRLNAYTKKLSEVSIPLVHAIDNNEIKYFFSVFVKPEISKKISEGFIADQITTDKQIEVTALRWMHIDQFEVLEEKTDIIGVVQRNKEILNQLREEIRQRLNPS